MLELSAYVILMPTEHLMPTWVSVQFYCPESPDQLFGQPEGGCLCVIKEEIWVSWKNDKHLISNTAVCRTDTRTHVTEYPGPDFFY